jgi:phosphinothricin acetyltransferase
VLIDTATPADHAGVIAVYNHYIEHSVATFDTEIETVESKADWLATFRQTGPHQLLVARAPDVVGFACTSPYRDHAAFDATVVMSLYIAKGHVGQGVGALLYDHLFGAVADTGLHRALAGIALPNDASIALHRRFGFTDVGTFDEYATKWGRPLSTLWMQRPL